MVNSSLIAPTSRPSRFQGPLFRHWGPLFDGEENPTDPTIPPKNDPPKTPPKEEKDPPKEPMVQMSQAQFDQTIKDRIDQAIRSHEKDLKTKADLEQGQYKKIVDEEFLPLQEKVKNELTPELESYRSRIDQEIHRILTKLPAEVQALMPMNMSRTDKLEWLEKAQKVKPEDDKSKGKRGNDPIYPERGGDEEKTLTETRLAMIRNPIYQS